MVSRLERGDGVGHELYLREHLRQGDQTAKALIQQNTWNLEGTAKRPMWLAWIEQERA